MTIRVLLVDDQPLLRTGFRLMLEAEPDITVVGEAGDGRGRAEQARALLPDVVLMDIRMPRRGRHRGDPPDRAARPRRRAPAGCWC